MIDRDEIVDGKTIGALFTYDRIRRSGSTTPGSPTALSTTTQRMPAGTHPERRRFRNLADREHLGIAADRTTEIELIVVFDESDFWCGRSVGY